MKVVVNRCFGGFGLSDAAYEKLIEYGVPVRGYVKTKRGPDGRFLLDTQNDGEVIFDDELSEKKSKIGFQRYWDTWTRDNRTHPLVVRVVEELGDAANGMYAALEVVEIPDGIEWEIDEYDGIEKIAEKHRTW